MSTTSDTQQVILPELGESVTEGTIVEWRVGVGDTISPGDILLELTTDKVDVEVPAPFGGVLVAILAAEGETVEVGAALAEISSNPNATPAPPAPAPGLPPRPPRPSPRRPPSPRAPRRVAGRVCTR